MHVSGAPARWKMTSPMRAEDDRTSTKSASGRSSPASSRENSGERRGRASLPDGLKSLGGRRTPSRDSSETSSSRDSSLESKGKDKTLTNSDGPLVNGNSETKVKGRRGRRPKSLNLNEKGVNGDNETFKSPHPLTPCNLTVKKRKGRPKETPPTLVAEPPVEVEEADPDSTTVVDQPPKKRIGRPPKKFRAGLLKKHKFVEGDKKTETGKFGLKHKIQKGFLRRKGLGSMTRPRAEPTVSTDIGNSERMDVDETTLISPDSGSAIKRKPGRPPGSKNKIWTSPNVPKSVRSPKTSLSISAKFRSPGRSPGLKNKGKTQNPAPDTTVSKPGTTEMSVFREMNKRKKEELNSEMAKDESKTSIDIDNDELTDSADETSADSDEDIDRVGQHNNKNEKDDKSCVIETATGVNETAVTESQTVESYTKLETKDSLDESIEMVVYKAKNDLPIDEPPGLKFPFFRSRGINPLAKRRKMKAIETQRRKQMIAATFAKTDVETVKVLPDNDLRRKLQKKYLEKKIEEAKREASDMKLENVVTSSNDSDTTPFSESTTENMESNDQVELSDQSKVIANYSENTDETIKTETNTSEIETEASAKVVEMEVKKPGRRRKYSFDSKELVKFSDTESVCSEISTVSQNSLKKAQLEKHVLVLGEENVDSDDSSIRTRQRFEIVPGKKRKRTLSGEFDLVDERQLRKEKKMFETGVTDNCEIKKRRKRTSPKANIVKPKKCAAGESFKARKQQLIRQSPFLTFGKKRGRKRKPFFNRKPNLLIKQKATEERNSEEHSSEDNVQTCDSKPEVKDTHNSGAGSSEKADTDIAKLDVHRKSLFEQFKVDSDSDIKSVPNTDKNGPCKTEVLEPVIESVKETLNSEANVIASTLIRTYDQSDVEVVVEDVLACIVNSVVKSREQSLPLFNDSYFKISGSLPQKPLQTVQKKLSNVQQNLVGLSQQKTTSNIVEQKQEESVSPKKDVNKDEEKSVEIKRAKSTTPVRETPKLVTLNDTFSGLQSHATITSDKQTPVEGDKLKRRRIFRKKAASPLPITQKNSDSDVKNNSDVKIGRKKRAKSLTPVKEKNITQAIEHVVKKPRLKTSRTARKGGASPRASVSDVGQSEEKPNTEKLEKPQTDKVGKATSEKLSPESTVTRKFELRQKISRSPLENIAMKQSLEESVYLKQEQEKATRKEAKLKSKQKALLEEACDSNPAEVNSDAETEIMESDTETPANLTIEEQLKRCKKCSVVLTDFIKKLNITASARNVAEDSIDEDSQISENDTTQDEETCTEQEEEGVVEHVSIENDEAQEEVMEPEATLKHEEEIDDSESNEKHENDKQEMNTMTKLIDNKETFTCDDKLDQEKTVKDRDYDNKISQDNDNEMNEDQDHNNVKSEDKSDDVSNDQENTFANDQAEHKTSPEKDVLEIAEINEETSPENKKKLNADEHSELKTEPKSVINENSPKSSEENAAVSSPLPQKKVVDLMPSPRLENQSQTARKTVPPLKIKVKDLSSRRKKYVVQPSPDSPVETENNAKPRDKPKKKSKSGNKSESDNEKHNKNHHHHHKKRTKSPTEDGSKTTPVKESPNKVPLTPVVESPNKIETPKKESPQLKPIKPMDAYEATFLQFIQQKDQNEEKQKVYMNVKRTQKHNSDVSSKQVSAAETESQTSPNEVQKAVVTEQLVSPKSQPLQQESSPARAGEPSLASQQAEGGVREEVRYVCSQCSDVWCTTEQAIQQHYRDVHPSVEFMYKPLADESGTNMDKSQQPSTGR